MAVVAIGAIAPANSATPARLRAIVGPRETVAVAGEVEAVVEAESSTNAEAAVKRHHVTEMPTTTPRTMIRGATNLLIHKTTRITMAATANDSTTGRIGTSRARAKAAEQVDRPPAASKDRTGANGADPVVKTTPTISLPAGASNSRKRAAVATCMEVVGEVMMPMKVGEAVEAAEMVAKMIGAMLEAAVAMLVARILEMPAPAWAEAAGTIVVRTIEVLSHRPKMTNEVLVVVEIIAHPAAVEPILPKEAAAATITTMRRRMAEPGGTMAAAEETIAAGRTPAEAVTIATATGTIIVATATTLPKIATITSATRTKTTRKTTTQISSNQAITRVAITISATKEEATAARKAPEAAEATCHDKTARMRALAAVDRSPDVAVAGAELSAEAITITAVERATGTIRTRINPEAKREARPMTKDINSQTITARTRKTPTLLISLKVVATSRSLRVAAGVAVAAAEATSGARVRNRLSSIAIEAVEVKEATTAGAKTVAAEAAVEITTQE